MLDTKTKTCVVFGVTTDSCQGPMYGGVDFYIFDKDFIPVSFDGDVIPEYQKKKNNEQQEDDDDDDDDDEPPMYWPILKDPSLIALPSSCKDHYHISQSYATLHGRVYCAGGSTTYCITCNDDQVGQASKRADCWDTENGPCWTRLPDTKVGRESFKLHVLEGKLYAVGGAGYTCQPFSFERLGTGYSYQPLFIERLDESASGCYWTSLSAPPSSVRLNYVHFVSAAFEDKGFILFGSNAFEYFYAYIPPPLDTWIPMLNIPFISELHYRYIHSQTVAQNRLFWLTGEHGSTLGVLEINDGSYFTIDLEYEGLLPDGFLELDSSPQVVHVGDGVLAVVWSDSGHYHLEGQGKGKCDDICYLHRDFRDSYKRFHCCRFSVNFVKAKKKCCKFWSNTERRCLLSPCLGRKKCCKLLSHQTCVGPKFPQKLDAAFVVDVAVPVGDRTSINSRSILPRKRGRDSVLL